MDIFENCFLILGIVLMRIDYYNVCREILCIISLLLFVISSRLDVVILSFLIVKSCGFEILGFFLF